MTVPEPVAAVAASPRRRRRGHPLPLSAEHEALVAAYAADLRAAGLRGDHADVWGGRAFCARFGDGTAWQHLSLEEQLALNVKIQRFAAWMIATCRLMPSAEYVVARRPLLGRVLVRQHAAFFAQLELTATALGFGWASRQRQWAALAQACAVRGLAPEELTHQDLDAARAALCEAGKRLDRGTMRHLRTAMFGLEATLFHAGVTDELPRKRVMEKASERARQWAEIAAAAPKLAETMTRYVEQVGLSLRPGTTRRHEAVTREFGRFVLKRDRAVVAAADVRRCHVEDYKTWLAERPAARGGKLHRHTIRERLGVVRNFFERIIEWDWEDVPDRVPVFSGDFPIKDEPLPRFLDDPAPRSSCTPRGPTTTPSCAWPSSCSPGRDCARASCWA